MANHCKNIIQTSGHTDNLAIRFRGSFRWPPRSQTQTGAGSGVAVTCPAGIPSKHLSKKAQNYVKLVNILLRSYNI